MLPTQPCWNSCGDGTPARTGRPTRRRRGQGLPRSSLWEPTTGRSHCIPSDKANRLASCHTRSRVCGHRKALHRDEGHVAMRCPCCDAVDVDTRHARICPRAEAQVNQNQPLLHAISRTLKRLGIPNQVESGEPFAADRNLRVDIVVRRRGLRDTPNRAQREVHPAGRHSCRSSIADTPAGRQR